VVYERPCLCVRTTSTARRALSLADNSPERKLGDDTAVLKVFVALTGKERVTPVFVHTWGDTYDEQVFSITQGAVLRVEVTVGSDVLESLWKRQ
jgi:hypothetical protein